jgi:hypothetical protein
MSNRENRRPEFRVGKYVDSTEPNEIHDALVSRVGPFDHFSKSVPSITKQEYHPSSGFLGLLELFLTNHVNDCVQELFEWTQFRQITRQKRRIIAKNLMIGKIGLLQGIRQKFSKENLKIAKRSFASKSKIFL